MTFYGMEYSFGQSGSAILVVVPSSVLATAGLLAGKAEREKRKSWCCASTAQQ